MLRSGQWGPSGRTRFRSSVLTGVLALGLLGPAAVLPPTATARQERPRPSSGDTVFVAGGDTVPFRHAEHSAVDCLDCHSTEEAHGTVTVTSIRGCRSCHHEGPTAEPCTRCHAPTDLGRDGGYDVLQDLRMSVGTVRGRELPFSHGDHGSDSCAACHADGPARSAASLRCAECHRDHHRAEAECASCHREAPAESHPLAVHATCTGSGCHDPASARVTATTMEASDRSVCVSCHPDQRDHREGERCARCHLMPPAEDGGER